jgi:hypothetical protein
MPGMAMSGGQSGGFQDAFLDSMRDTTNNRLFTEDEKSLARSRPGDVSLSFFNATGLQRIFSARNRGEIDSAGNFREPATRISPRKRPAGRAVATSWPARNKAQSKERSKDRRGNLLGSGTGKKTLIGA